MKKRKLFLLAAVMLGLGIIGTAVAFLTDTQTLTNVFTIGGVKISLTEPTWDSTGKTKATNITPKVKVEKDPTITNTGTNDAYVFMKVVVPYENVTIDETTAFAQLFDYTLNSNWVEVGTATTDESAKTITHVYAYAADATSAMTVLKKSEKAILFNDVTFANVKNTNGLSSELNIVVTGYAIQTDNIVTGTATAANVWSALESELN